MLHSYKATRPHWAIAAPWPGRLRERKKMELEEKREMKAGLIVFQLRARKAFGFREQVKTHVMLIYDNRERKRKFIIFNKGLTREIHEKISRWLDATLCFHDIVHKIGPEGIDADQWQI